MKIIQTVPELPDTRRYLAHVNEFHWRGRAAGQWLCSSITARKEDNGLWAVTYQFDAAPETLFNGEAIIFPACLNADFSEIDRTWACLVIPDEQMA